MSDKVALPEIGEVSDGWARYNTRIETRIRRGKPQWRYVIERRFVGADRWWKTGRWSRNDDRVRRRAVRQMRRLDHAVKNENVEGYL